MMSHFEIEYDPLLAEASPFFKGLFENPDMSAEITSETAAIIQFTSLKPSQLAMYEIDPEYLLCRTAIMTGQVQKIIPIVQNKTYMKMLLKNITFKWFDFYDISLVANNRDYFADMIDSRGNTLLMGMLQTHDQYNACTLMKKINDGVNPRHVNNDGDTALIIACRKKQEQVALELVKMDCNPGHVNLKNDTALLWACWNDLPEVAYELVKMGPICKPEHIDSAGGTALIYACTKKMNDVAKLLLTMDCVPGQQTNVRNTALLKACWNGMSEVALKLLDMDCNPHLLNSDSCTALMLACHKGLSEVALKLLDMNCLPLHVDTYGTNALYHACQNEMKEVVFKLFKVTDMDAGSIVVARNLFINARIRIKAENGDYRDIQRYCDTLDSYIREYKEL